MFSCRYSSKRRKLPWCNKFCVILNFVRLVLVRNSAISSSDSPERHFFYSLVNKQLDSLVTEVPPPPPRAGTRLLPKGH